MPRTADDVRTRLLRKLTKKREAERRKTLNREQRRLSQINETKEKINELFDSIEEGTGVLRDIEKVSAQIRAKSFSEGVSQGERDALDRLDRQRVAMERKLAELNESVSMLQDFLKQLTDD